MKKICNILNIPSSRCKAFTITGIIILALIFVDNIFFGKYATLKKTAKKIEEIILDFDDESEQYYNKFIQFYVSHNDINEFFSEKYNKNFTTLIYVDSALVYWSDNESNYPWYVNTIINKTPVYETNNSNVYYKTYHFGNISFLNLLPINHNYNVENKYINNGFYDFYHAKSTFKPNFNFAADDDFIIKNNKNIPLFSIVKSNDIVQKNNYFSTILMLALIIHVAALLATIIFHSKKIKNEKFKIPAMGTALLLLRITALLIQKANPFNSVLCGNKYFSGLPFFNSCCDIALTSSFLIVFSIFLFRHCHENKENFNIKNKKIIHLLKTTAILIVVGCSVFIYKGLVNSSLEITYFNVSNLNVPSIIITISMMLFLSSAVLIALSILLFTYQNNQKGFVMKNPTTTMVLLSLVLTIIFISANISRNNKLIVKLSENNIFSRNKTLETNILPMFNNVKENLLTLEIDSKQIQSNGKSEQVDNILEQNVANLFKNNYIVDYTIADTTLTRPNNNPKIQNTNAYFDNIIKKDAVSVAHNTWYINDIANIPYYLLKMETNCGNIWFEIKPKYNIEGIGYPELLTTDENFNIRINLAEYSLAIYKNDTLARSIGTFSYPLTAQKTFIDHSEKLPKQRHYRHFVFTKNDSVDVIIVKPKNFLKTTLYSFSLFFLGILMFSLILILIIPKEYFNTLKKSLTFRLQSTIIYFFTFTVLIIGSFSIFIISKLNERKNLRNLAMKTFSLTRNFQNELNNADTLSNENLNVIVRNLAKLNFCDINVYDKDGYLYTTSNNEMFNNNLTSNLINPKTISHLANNNRYMIKENIGKYRFYSSYMITTDKRLNLFIVNIPYFVKQTFLKKEISDFVMSFINIFSLIFLIILYVMYKHTRRITQPLKNLQDSIADMNFDNNEHVVIDYDREDEISTLIKVYNKKVDELKKNAELLAKTEREMAWRDMAKQVAHEIKNPLTPMRLSTQFIHRMWMEKRENFGELINKYKDSMISSIDNMSNIATAFSHFASLPAENKKNLNVNAIIAKIVDFYKQSNYKIDFVHNKDEVMLFADEEQMIRVFHNLIKNSIQAYEAAENCENELLVTIESLYDEEEKKLTVFVTDNGPGIDKSIADKIFVPNFTTKSSGSGFGLAIVRKIINNTHNGIICHVDDYTSGARFMLVFDDVDAQN